MCEVISRSSAAEAPPRVSSATTTRLALRSTAISGQLFKQRLPTCPGFVARTPVPLVGIRLLAFAHESMTGAAVNHRLVFFSGTPHQFLPFRNCRVDALVVRCVKAVNGTGNVFDLCLLIRRGSVERVGCFQFRIHIGVLQDPAAAPAKSAYRQSTVASGNFQRVI